MFPKRDFLITVESWEMPGTCQEYKGGLNNVTLPASVWLKVCANVFIALDGIAEHLQQCALTEISYYQTVFTAN